VNVSKDLSKKSGMYHKALFLAAFPLAKGPLYLLYRKKEKPHLFQVLVTGYMVKGRKNLPFTYYLHLRKI